MSNLGAALGWKFNHAPGIRTKKNVITGWPSGLGAKPNAATKAAIIAEYDAYRASVAYLDDRKNDPDMPSDHDIVMAIIEGGQDLAAIKVLVNAVNAKHPKP